jgi:hypothetical protein
MSGPTATLTLTLNICIPWLGYKCSSLHSMNNTPSHTATVHKDGVPVVYQAIAGQSQIEDGGSQGNALA